MALRRLISALSMAACCASYSASAQLEEPTVLGALSDDPSRAIQVGGQPVLVYQAARNALLRSQNRFQEVTLYYSAPPRIRRGPDGRADVRVNRSIATPGRSLIQFTLEPAPVSREAIVAAVRETDPYVKPESILPLAVFGLEVRLLDAPAVIFPQENSSPFASPYTVDVPVDTAQASEVVEALRRGATVRVAFRTLVKLSQLADTSIKWSEVKNTRTFRDYNGPSGPQHITAAQAVDASIKILSELRVFHWEEVDPSKGGATGDDYRQYLDSILNRLLASRQPRLVEFERWADTQRFDVPLADFQKKIDEVRKVAVDAKQLDNNEWCRKYSSQLKSLAEATRTGSSDSSTGLSIGIPKILTLGFDTSAARSSSSSSRNQFENALQSEDCGKRLVEDNYRYEFDGVRYIPKSIKVYERNAVAGSIAGDEQFAVYRIRQRLGRNEWSISTN